MKRVEDSYLAKDGRVNLWLMWDGEGYRKEPKSDNEWFETEYKRHSNEIKWKDWKKENLTHYQDVLIKRYVDEGFYMIALQYRGKRPIEEWTLEENRLDRKNAMRYMLRGGNLGVVCGNYSKGLVGIDFDHRVLKPPFDRLARETLTCKSSRGYHVYFRTDRNTLPEGFADGLRSDYDTECRFDKQYFVLPLSVHDSTNSKRYVYYDFVDWTKPILNLSVLLKGMERGGERNGAGST